MGDSGLFRTFMLERFTSEELLFELTRRDPDGVGHCATNYPGDHEFLVGIGKDQTYLMRLEDDDYQALLKEVN